MNFPAGFASTILGSGVTAVIALTSNGIGFAVVVVVFDFFFLGFFVAAVGSVETSSVVVWTTLLMAAGCSDETSAIVFDGVICGMSSVIGFVSMTVVVCGCSVVVVSKI